MTEFKLITLSKLGHFWQLMLLGCSYPQWFIHMLSSASLAGHLQVVQHLIENPFHFIIVTFWNSYLVLTLNAFIKPSAESGIGTRAISREDCEVPYRHKTFGQTVSIKGSEN